MYLICQCVRKFNRVKKQFVTDCKCRKCICCSGNHQYEVWARRDGAAAFGAQNPLSWPYPRCRQAGPGCLIQWRPLHYKNLLKSHAAFHVYGEHMGKPTIFRPQNKPLCSWTHDRSGSFLTCEPHPRGVGPLTVIKPPQFSQQNRSYIKLKYRGLINKVWAGEKKNWVKDGHNDLQTIFPLTVMGSHEIHFKTQGRCLPRQRRKKQAEKKRPWLQPFIQMSSLCSFTMEPVWILAQCSGTVLYLCGVPLFFTEEAGRNSYRGEIWDIIVQTNISKVYLLLK